MGLAILLIMLFHSERLPIVGKLQDFCDIGVDLFLFCGAYTCTASYLRQKEKSSRKGFIKYLYRRCWRIIPPYLILWGFVFAASAIITGDSFVHFLRNLSLWDSWLHNSRFLWYIPSVLTMYFLLPFYVQASQKWKGLWFLPFTVILINVVMGIHSYEPAFQMTLTRLPIFLLGIIAYLYREKQLPCGLKTLFIVSGLAVLTFYALSKTVWPEYSNLEIKRTCYIPGVVLIIYLWNMKNHLLATLGSFTLEIYLIHEYLVYQPLCAQCGFNPLVATFLAIPIAIILSWCYHIFLNKIVYK